ncbi:MAG: F0F1 ATP synthase subunit gamma [Alphaproteobacteria bacterium]|nr:MAG: F0F1 ATP synthase subunit gamma [Alphaproteobacteria bacterium]
MASLKDLRARIASVKSTQKITKAMKMVAASKLRRAQEAAEAARPYAERMEEIMRALASAVVADENAPKLLVGTGRSDRHLLVVATSERGLCGGFNTNIVRAARRHADRLLAEGRDVRILCVGKKGAAVLRRLYGERVFEVIDLGHVRRLGYRDADEVAARIRHLYEEQEFDVATIFYARFKSALTQIPTARQLIPVPIEDKDTAEAGGETAWEFEPEEEAILAELLPRNLSVQVFRALLENAASEQGARMTAMDSATRNAGELIDKLTLQYNRTRQAVITKELIEIISGAEAI